jgi:hypothetical protein
MSKAPNMPEKPSFDKKGRQISEGSAAFFEDDEYGEYDFTPNSRKGGGGGGRGDNNPKKSGGRGVYTSKHIRAKESIRQKSSK